MLAHYAHGTIKQRRTPVALRHWLLGVAVFLIVLLVAGIALYWYLRGNADAIIRRRMVATLQARFDSPVEIRSLHLSVRNGIKVTGGGLRILSLAGPTAASASGQRMQPTVLRVANFRFETNFAELLKPRMRIVTVRVDGLELDIPPRGQRGWKVGSGSGHAQPPGAIVIDQVICTNSKIVIAPKETGKLPLIFNVASLTLTDMGERKALRYEAVLTNPKPVGDVRATGHFGPWVAANPRDTPLDGSYSFLHADLGTIRGIGGMLTSTGNFTGRLGSLTVAGETDTPNLTLTVSEHPVPVHTRFVATVDGTTGDTRCCTQSFMRSDRSRAWVPRLRVSPAMPSI